MVGGEGGWMQQMGLHRNPEWGHIYGDLRDVLLLLLLHLRLIAAGFTCIDRRCAPHYVIVHKLIILILYNNNNIIILVLSFPATKDIIIIIIR